MTLFQLMTDLNQLIQYCWDDELEDYQDNCVSDKPEVIEEMVIFSKL